MVFRGIGANSAGCAGGLWAASRLLTQVFSDHFRPRRCNHKITFERGDGEGEEVVTWRLREEGLQRGSIIMRTPTAHLSTWITHRLLALGVCLALSISSAKAQEQLPEQPANDQPATEANVVEEQLDHAPAPK